MDENTQAGWYEDFEAKMLEEIKDCKGEDLRFFRLEEYLRNAERIDKLSANCKQCAQLKERIAKTVPTIKLAIEKPGRKRKELDNVQQDIIDHMKKVHGYYPAQYHRYMQSIYWLLGFMALAAVLVRIFPELPKAAFYSPAFIIGVTIGQIVGGKKDRKIIQDEKQL